MPHLDRTAKETGPVEVNRPSETNAPDANPDKLVLPEGMERREGANDFRDLADSIKDRMDNKRIERYKDAMMPRAERFDGEVGNSLVRPDSSLKLGPMVKQYLEKLGMKGIEYCNGFPDFSPAAVETVTIPNMTADKTENFKQAYNALAEKWNSEGREGRTDWKASDVKQWKHENGLDLHEKEDLRTCEFVPSCIHQHYGHVGGRFICKAKGIFSENQMSMMHEKRDFYDQFDA